MFCLKCICYHGLAGYASWVKRRSFKKILSKGRKNSVEKINVTIQKNVYFPDTFVDNIIVMDMGVLRSEMGWTQMSKTQWIKGIARPECIRLMTKVPFQNIPKIEIENR